MRQEYKHCKKRYKFFLIVMKLNKWLPDTEIQPLHRGNFMTKTRRQTVFYWNKMLSHFKLKTVCRLVSAKIFSLCSSLIEIEYEIKLVSVKIPS